MKPVVRFVITDTHMGLSHDGLTEVIRQHKKKNPLFARVLETEGGMVLFVNGAMTKLKLYSPNSEVIGYLKLTGGRRVSAGSIDQIPATFGGSVEYSRAVKSALSNLVKDSKAIESPVYKTKLSFDKTAMAN